MSSNSQSRQMELGLVGLRELFCKSAKLDLFLFWKGRSNKSRRTEPLQSINKQLSASSNFYHRISSAAREEFPRRQIFVGLEPVAGLDYPSTPVWHSFRK